jgi:hypothetical protein
MQLLACLINTSIQFSLPATCPPAVHFPTWPFRGDIPYFRALCVLELCGVMSVGAIVVFGILRTASTSRCGMIPHVYFSMLVGLPCRIVRQCLSELTGTGADAGCCLDSCPLHHVGPSSN